MPAGQVGPLPERLARARVQAGRAKTAEVDIDPARLNHRRRRGVTVHGGAVAERFRVVAVKHLLVEADLRRSRRPGRWRRSRGRPSVAVVSQTWPPITTGVDQPRYGISVFHLTLFVSLQCSGRPIGVVSPGAETWPSPHGPRNSGQSARAAGPPMTNRAATMT